MLGGLGACSPRKILNFVTTEEICNLWKFLVTSETGPVSDIYWFPSLLIVSSRTEHKAEVNLRVKNEQNCQFGHFHPSNFLHVHVLRMVSNSQVGQPAFKGGGASVPSPTTL